MTITKKPNYCDFYNPEC